MLLQLGASNTHDEELEHNKDQYLELVLLISVLATACAPREAAHVAELE
jgi:hypothetical protein